MMKLMSGFPLLLLLVVEWVSLFVPSESVSDSEVSALAAFKKEIYEDPLSKLSDWNTQDGDPCSWSGVRCSDAQNHVISLNVSSSSLKGFLTAGLGSLTSLQELVLDNNFFLGPIPSQLSMLKSLTLLNLSVNQLSGPVPSEFRDLTSITKMDLHSNGLTGTVPPELGELSNLVELRLDRNKLHGIIPGSNDSYMFDSRNNGTGLCQLHELGTADFSYNFFIGKIPACLKNLQRSSFQGNCFQDQDSLLQQSAQQCSSMNGEEVDTYKNSHDGNKHKSQQQPVWLLVLEIITGAVVFVFLITCTVAAVKRCKPKSATILPWRKTTNWKEQTAISIDGELLKNALRISRKELEVACEDFSNIIGSFPDSVVYKGTMKDGPEIAVISIRISEDHWTSYLELYFQTQVADLARLTHENIAKLLGYCKESDPFSRMLVFEYASNGTLHEHIHYGDGCQLSWLRRMKIAVGIARGLRYLHTKLQPPFAISEFSSSAVYLTEDFSPQFVDFEKWKTLRSKSVMNSCYAINAGSLQGFLDSHERRYMDVQENTFAFGVLLLELISGRPPYSKEKGSLVDWAIKYLVHPEEISKLVDLELKNVKPNELSIICSVISLCIEAEPSRRPSMQIICAMLEDGIDTSAAAVLKDSRLAWAELDISL